MSVGTSKICVTATALTVPPTVAALYIAENFAILSTFLKIKGGRQDARKALTAQMLKIKNVVPLDL